MAPPVPARKWLFLIAALLILGSVLGLQLYFEYNTIAVRERERLAAQAKVVDENLNQQLIATNHALDSIRRDLPSLKMKRNSAALLNRLQSMRGAMPSTRAVTVFDANGTLIARSPDQFAGQNFSNRGYFQAAREGGNPVTLYVAPPFMAATGEYVLNVSKVLLDERGKFAGVILVSLGPEYFRTLLKSVLYAPDMLSSLIHGGGKVIFRVPDTQGVTGMDLAARPGAFFIQHMKSGRSTNMFEGIVASTGEARLTVFRTIRTVPMDKPLVIVVSRELTALFADWREDLFVRGGLFVLLILVAALGLYTYQQRQRAYGGLVADQEAERKRAEEALRESEERLALVLTGSQLGFWDWDLKTNEVRRNERWAEMLGYSLQDIELSVKQGVDFVHPDDQELVTKSIRDHLEGRTAMHKVEYRMRTKDGQYRWIFDQAKVVKYDPDGRPIRMSGTHTDITDRKRTEEERQMLEERLQRAEKMEALGQLAGGVAHDLNNVLGILSGYSELLLEEIPTEHRSRIHVEKILESTEKGAAIIQDLLTLARRGVMVSDVINLNHVVSGFLNTPVFEKMKDYNPRVIFRTELDKNLLNIKGSPVHLEKTLMNLVSNAAESIPGIGEVTIRTESRYLDRTVRGYDEVKEGDYAVLTVSDTGMGIPAENREKIFEPFYTKKAMGRSGTGLGLAIVWGTVKDHHGYIDVQTEIGEGTTFTLYFPATREELMAQQQKAPIEQYLGKGESVLVVDDVAGQRDVAARLLARLGYQVHAVSSGEEAAEYLKEHKADILVLDMIMAPGIDGLETYRRVLEINPKQKAIIVSGFSETERVREAQKLGAGAYVKKPYIMEKIGLAIRHELTR